MQYISDYDGVIIKLLNIGFSFMLHIIGAIMAFLVLQKIAGYICWQKSKGFNFLSKNTMPIYLSHQQVIYYLIYWLNSVVNPYIHGAINFAGTMVASLVISTVLMKFKVTRFLIGEK